GWRSGGRRIYRHATVGVRPLSHRKGRESGRHQPERSVSELLSDRVEGKCKWRASRRLGQSSRGDRQAPSGAQVTRTTRHGATMILLLVVWTLMVAGAVSLGMKMSLPVALVTWAALTAVLCAAGAILMQLQPIGIATPTGRVGSSFVYWGFDVGRGQLIPAAVISWLIWIFLGSAIIALTQFRS